jgi:indole-3-glycerol phosphate synthase
MITLENIIDYKRQEVQNTKSLFPVKLLEASVYFEPQCVSLSKYLTRKDKSGIIAEIKKQSPSLGVINKYIDVEKTSIGYMQAGASALSVLTDKKFFGGCNDDLVTARKYNFCPILRKDFIVDEYQIIEAKSIGADAVLLIAAVLSQQEIKSFTGLAQRLCMEVVLELHDELEIMKCIDEVNVIGVNNRNLNTMKIDTEHSVRMSALLPADKIKISESGIESAQKINYLKKAGYSGFLIGSYFMRHARPHEACKDLIENMVVENNNQLISAL